ncbi:ribonuclease HII [Candidatus Dependentiae bacterium]|nr:ribonuclease HII [Candidatus Dependentiae bacterium]
MVTFKIKERFKKNHYEAIAWQEGRLVCGIDEVGRGCLAGPVVTAAAILLPNKKNPLIKDSKLLSQEELQKAYKWLTKNSWSSVAIVNHRDIDIYNIYHATLRAMKRAFMQLTGSCPQQPSAVLVDAMPLTLLKTPYEHLDVYHFPFGERRSDSIAAASIIAKVKRDELMRNLARSFPNYHFGQHKGYATKLHRQAVHIHGSSIVHRLSFLENKAFAQKR